MMTRTTPNPTIGQSERLFTVRFSKHDSADRDELERFISDIFRESYGTEIKRFRPYLMGLRDQDDNLIAACSLHSAATERLFLENYLTQPIEAVLSEHTGLPVKRSEIIEIGNFSVADLAMAHHLITAINDQLHFTAKQWAVITAVPALRDAFIKLGMNPDILTDADINLLPVEARAEWGNYFEQNPQSMAIRRMERRNKPRLKEPGITAP